MCEVRQHMRNDCSTMNPVCFFDLAVKETNEPLGRIEMMLRADIVPHTAENFRVLCTGDRGFGYKGSSFHRIAPGFMMQGGIYSNAVISKAMSIYGDKFPEENHVLRHSGPGTLSMVRMEDNMNTSQFFITFARTSWLDGKNVAFGNVIEGMDIVMKISKLLNSTVVIVDCGQII
eukprot:m.20396 g.20396  ORF g.20396 m.20396 type:complete len:175 (+) comp12128_c0_seq1:541-1065(+)